MPGMHGWVHNNRAIQECDVLINIGSRFDDRVTGKTSTFAPNAKSHPCRPRSIRDRQEHPRRRADRRRRPERAAGDAARSCSRATHPNGWRISIDIRDGAHSPQAAVHAAGYRYVHAARRLRGLQPHRQRARRLSHLHRRRPAPDVGGPADRVATGRTTHITSGGLGTMGFALPAAMGVQVAQPNETVWAIAGDGGFQMTIPGAGDDRPGAAAGQDRDHQQRLPGHGAPVAGAVP